MEAGDDGELLHGELLGRLLVGVAARAADLGRGAQVLGLCEPLQAILKRDVKI
jgi:hypothetical protein